MHSFADIEDQVPTIACRESLDQIARMTHAVNRMAKLTQGTVNRLDRAGLIKFSRLLLAITESKIVGTKIVSETDVHVYLLLNRVVVPVLSTFVISQQDPIAV